MVVDHTEDTAGGSVDTAGIVVVEDMVPLGHSLFAALQLKLKVGARIRHKN